MEIAELPIPEMMGRPRAWYAQRRVDIGPRAWAMQFEQRALSDVDQKFRPAAFARFDVARLDIRYCRALTFIDPAGGLPTGDYTAMAMLVIPMNEASGLPVGDALLWRAYCDHTALTDLAPVIRLWCDEWRPRSPHPCQVNCEINGGWESGWIALRRHELEAYDTSAGVKHSGAKDGRIETVGIYAARAPGAGKLWLRTDAEDDLHMRRGLAQLWDWPLGAHDDFPDALAAALEIAQLGYALGGTAMKAVRPRGLGRPLPMNTRG